MSDDVLTFSEMPRLPFPVTMSARIDTRTEQKNGRRIPAIEQIRQRMVLEGIERVNTKSNEYATFYFGKKGLEPGVEARQFSVFEAFTPQQLECALNALAADCKIKVFGKFDSMAPSVKVAISRLAPKRTWSDDVPMLSPSDGDTLVRAEEAK